MTPEVYTLERLNRECFGESDDYSKPGAIGRLLKGDVKMHIMYDSRHPDVGIGYWFAKQGKFSDLLRYGIVDEHKGRGLSAKLLDSFWEQHLLATTYVGVANASSTTALIRSGFQVITVDNQGWIHLIGVNKERLGQLLGREKAWLVSQVKV